MFEYASVSSSSYDIDGFVSKLNAQAADGWDVVSVVSTGGDVTAIVKRASSAAVSSSMASSSITAVDDGAATVADTVSSYEPAPSVEESAPSMDATSSMEASPSYDAAPSYAAAVEAAPAYTPEPAPEPAPSFSMADVVEPSGWASVPEPAPMVEQAVPQAATHIPAVAPAPVEVPAPVVAPAPVITTPAGWYPDPSGRFEMRYWDGTAWTEHVSRAGQQYTDPPVA